MPTAVARREGDDGPIELANVMNGANVERWVRRARWVAALALAGALGSGAYLALNYESDRPQSQPKPAEVPRTSDGTPVKVIPAGLPKPVIDHLVHEEKQKAPQCPKGATCG